MNAPLIDLDELERRSQCALGFQRYEEAALLAAVRAAVTAHRNAGTTSNGDGVMQAHDFEALDATLAPFRKEKADD